MYTLVPHWRRSLVSAKSLTIVLPVHNAERRLRDEVGEMLELASELTDRFGILIVDDGSTDATYDVAEDLAARFPQVSVKRHRNRSGLGPTLDYVHKHVRSDAIVFHDGVTPIDLNQLRVVWRRWIAQSSREIGRPTSAADSLDLSDFDDLSAIHAAMEQSHRSVLGFNLIAPADHATALDTESHETANDSPRTDAAHVSTRHGVGQIPRLPRPRFLSALTEFALGE